MSNPTSNFGWQMPTSTDLVTDLPADFEVFGQAVDTSLADLKGGTTGQVLKKNTNADMDFVWGADSAGMTNPMTTTGDTIYSSSGSTPARLGIGSTGQVMTVSGGVPTWAAPSATGKNWSLLNSGGTDLTGAATITVSGISAADGILIAISSASTTSSGATLGFRFNADSGNNYNAFQVVNTGLTTYSAGVFYSQPYLINSSILAASNGNNAACSVTGYIFLSGANSSGVKTFWGVAGGDSVSSSINHDQRFFGGAYTGTSTISSVSIRSDSSNFDAGKIWVYTTA
jgi:hypothetical protein